MRLNVNLRLPARAPQVEPIPYQRSLPMKLKPSVSGKGNRTTDVACIQEMAVMFACFKNNEFNQNLCSKEIDKFQKCYKHFLDEKQVAKSREQKGIIAPGEKNLSAKQLNNFLRKFPPN